MLNQNPAKAISKHITYRVVRKSAKMFVYWSVEPMPFLVFDSLPKGAWKLGESRFASTPDALRFASMHALQLGKQVPA